MARLTVAVTIAGLVFKESRRTHTAGRALAYGFVALVSVLVADRLFMIGLLAVVDESERSVWVKPLS